MNSSFKGAALPSAHMEIVSVSLYRHTGKAHIYYRVYADRAAAVADQEANMLETRELVVAFADLGAALASFYTALQSRIGTLYPAAAAAQDAITLSQPPKTPT